MQKSNIIFCPEVRRFLDIAFHRCPAIRRKDE
jgi:hypothetical protein